MLASRPASSSSSSEARAQSAEATGSRQEENGATGVRRLARVFWTASCNDVVLLKRVEAIIECVCFISS